MKLEVVSIVTRDQVQIFGGFWEPRAPAPVSRAVEAWLLLPGASGAFYSQVQGPFASALADAGYPVLTLSTRGHDLAWLNRLNGKVYGLAAEIIAEAGEDIVAALDELERRGYRRIGLLGHSMGAIKGSYFLAHGGDPRICLFVQTSGGRIGRSRWEGAPNRDKIAQELERAERLVAEGRGDELMLFEASLQGRSYFTPNAFLDRHRDDRYDTLALAAGLTVPTIFLGGSNEPEMIPPGLLEQFQAAATRAKPSAIATIEGADHFYTGKAKEAIDAVLAFLRQME
ncbi:MAG: alpha/beta fold hydrolase [Chloroflexota bacterium]|nr:alpha/beta fold hydrolase [Dehalococcoidia bacterium]MDW8252906.1 alpha/beta fold hydrolase [Chloroflexota bacterium]